MTTNREVRKYFQASSDGHCYAYYAYQDSRAEYRTRYARLRLVKEHDKGEGRADVDAYNEHTRTLVTVLLPLHREERHRALVPVDTNLYQALVSVPTTIEQMRDVAKRLTDYQDYNITPTQLCADMRTLAERLHNLSSVMHRLGQDTSDRALDDLKTVLSPWT